MNPWASNLLLRCARISCIGHDHFSREVTQGNVSGVFRGLLLDTPGESGRENGYLTDEMVVSGREAW